MASQACVFLKEVVATLKQLLRPVREALVDGGLFASTQENRATAEGEWRARADG